MSACKNVLLLQTHSTEKREQIENILQHSQFLFQSLIPCVNNVSFKEMYGTDSDIYIDHIELITDIYEENTLELTFYTHITPCIKFCEHLMEYFNIALKLVYFNESEDFSGLCEFLDGFCILNNQFSYWQGMYLYAYDEFWESMESFFSDLENRSFTDYLRIKQVYVGTDQLRLKYEYDQYTLIQQIQKL